MVPNFEDEVTVLIIGIADEVFVPVRMQVFLDSSSSMLTRDKALAVSEIEHNIGIGFTYNHISYYVLLAAVVIHEVRV